MPLQIVLKKDECHYYDKDLPLFLNNQDSNTAINSYMSLF